MRGSPVITSSLLLLTLACSRSNDTRRWIENGPERETRRVYFTLSEDTLPSFSSCPSSPLSTARACRIETLVESYYARIQPAYSRLQAGLKSNERVEALHWHWSVGGFSATVNPPGGRVILNAIHDLNVEHAREPELTESGFLANLTGCSPRMEYQTNSPPCSELSCSAAQSTLRLTGEGARVAVVDVGYTDTRFVNPGTREVKNLLDPASVRLGDRISRLKFLSSQLNENKLRQVHSQGDYRYHGEAVMNLLAGMESGAAPEATVALLDASPDPQILYEDRVLRAVDNALLMNVDIINLSLGWTQPSSIAHQWWRRLLKSASALDVAVVAAIGNEGLLDGHPVRFPANYESQLYETLVAVGAGAFDGSNWRRVLFSSFAADKPDFVAPGCRVPVALWSGSTKSSFDGTSFSTPMVSGLLAQLRGAFPDIPTRILIEALKQTATSHGKRSPETGLGAPNVAEAYDFLKSGTFRR